MIKACFDLGKFFLIDNSNEIIVAIPDDVLLDGVIKHERDAVGSCQNPALIDDRSATSTSRRLPSINELVN